MPAKALIIVLEVYAFSSLCTYVALDRGYIEAEADLVGGNNVAAWPRGRIESRRLPETASHAIVER